MTLPQKMPSPLQNAPKGGAKGRFKAFLGAVRAPVWVFLGLAFCAAVAPVWAAEKAVPASRAEIELSFAPVVKRVAPAVVNIYTAKTVTPRQSSPLFNDPFFRRFFGDNFRFEAPGPKRRVQNSLGSGVIIDGDGILITNNHVIEGADEIKVVLSDRREYAAAVVGTDESTDLAVLRIDTEGETLPSLDMRDSDTVEVGDIVLAIGNPFGVGQTVTSGIVSALARTGVGTSELGAFIQTDAAINPGNSGGALVTMDGRLVGINSAIFSKSGGSLGIGFAIPSNMVRAVVAGVIRGGGRVIRPWLGATGQDVTADLAPALGLSRPVGVLINRVQAGSPAADAGLRVGDVVLSIDGHAVVAAEDLRYRVATLAPDGRTAFRIFRDGREQVLTITLLAPPETPPRNVSELTGTQPLQGAVVANMSPALAQELGLWEFEYGVYVLNVRARSNARQFGFQPGDRILSINDRDVSDVAQLQGLLQGAQNGWRIIIERHGEQLSLTVDR